RQEENIDYHKYQRKGKHILLRFPDRFHTDILLHHILVQSEHRQRHKHTTQKLLEEVLGIAGEIVKEENLGIGTVFNRIEGLHHIHIQAPRDEINRQDDRKQQEEGLQQ